MGFGSDDWIYWHLIHTHNSRLQAIQRFRYSTHFALRFTVFTNRILATDLHLSHYHFKSLAKSSLHRLIPFLPLFCNWKFRRLDSLPLLPSSYSGRLASRNSTLHSRLHTLTTWSHQSQSHIATDCQSISKSWCWAPSGAHDQTFLPFDSYGLVFLGCPLWGEDGSVLRICCWPSPA
jgi:hypothetical protein